MNEKLLRELATRDTKDIIEHYVATHSSLKEVAGLIMEDLERELRGETISYTLSHALTRLFKLGYSPAEIEDEFTHTKWENEVNEYFRRRTN